MSVEDLTLAMAMLRRTSETILREPIGAGDDDPTVVDYARAETLAAAATSIEGMLEYAR